MTTRYLQPSEWHHRGAPADAVLVKAAAVRAVGDTRIVEADISSGGIDRERDWIDPQGWSFDSYMRSGAPVLWGHAHHEPPIATAMERPRVEGNRVRARAQFPPAGVSERSDLIHRLIVAGTIRATSVGFKPLRWSYNEARGGVDFHEQELLEFSFVSVPANADAVVTAAKHLGLSLARLGLDADAVVLRLVDEGPGRWGRDDAAVLRLLDDNDARVLVLDAEPETCHVDPGELVVALTAARAALIGGEVARQLRQLTGRVD